MLTKQKILELPYVYTANVFSVGDRLCVGAGSERPHPSYLLDFENREPVEIAPAPGGTMSLVPVPGSDHHLVSVMGLFPPFIGLEAGIFLHTKKDGAWSSRMVIALPFSHRCEFLTVEGASHLLIGTCSKHKANPEDWKQAGEVYGVKVGDPDSCDWKPTLIMDNLYRNHGMTKSAIDGEDCLCVSGTEGIFAIRPQATGSYAVTRLFDTEVSEFVFIDLDHDGVDELVTIELFHGNTLNIYKKKDQTWERRYTSPLSFGHGLCAGTFKGELVIVVGSRRDTLALELHKVVDFANGAIERIILETGVGPTQTRLFTHKGTDYILSANQVKNEVALYS
ncbi:hypothetical protein EBZ70_00715 [bacterium]|nr:hypothetical protein [bacterium]